jgi:wyosine [tRNA(Phe)-imidazoG37] synthetase (radical SAM superfamily)
MLCAAPFIHSYVYNDGRHDVCCAYERDRKNPGDFSNWNSKDYQKLRKRMLEGNELPKECYECKIDIEQETGPLRDHFQTIYENIGSPQLDIETGTAIDAPLSYDLRMNNICNLTCRMCAPGSSSQIGKEAVKHPELWAESEWTSEDQVRYSSFDPSKIIENAGTIIDLRLLGGEPTLQPETKALLKELIRIKNTKVKLFITTNGTNFNNGFYDLVKQFDNTYIVISIDSWGKQHEYIRGPGADWATIWNNVQKIKEFSSCNIQQLVTTLNIFDFWKLQENSQMKVITKVCYSPDKYAPKNMPLKWKEKAIQIAKENNVYDKNIHVFNLMMEEGDPSLLKGFKYYTEMMDNVRNQHLIDYFPTTHEMLEDIG